MRLTCAAVLAALLVATAARADEGTQTRGTQTRYVELTNRAHDSVTSLAIATAGSDSFHDKPLGTPLRGGGDSATIEIASDSCLYDFRFRFRDGQTMVYQDVDICRGNRLRIEPPSAIAKRQRNESFKTADSDP